MADTRVFLEGDFIDNRLQPPNLNIKKVYFLISSITEFPKVKEKLKSTHLAADNVSFLNQSSFVY